MAVAGLAAGALVAGPTKAISGGTTAAVGLSDFVARVEKSDDINKDGDLADFNERTVCTGTLVHPMWVLTAQHCVPETDTEWGWVYVRIGNQRSDTGIERRKIAQIRRLPGYTGGHNDIALLKLNRPSYMQPIKLATPAYRSRWTTDPGRVAVDGIATGWGELSAGGGASTTIKRVTVRLRAWDLDKAGIPEINLDPYAYGPVGPCKGDSGGPLLLRADNFELRQVGVVKGSDCDGWANYSEVGAGSNRDWIRAQIPDIDAPKRPLDYESWASYGAPISGGGCGSDGCQTYRTFDYAPAVGSYNDVQRVFVVTNRMIYSRARYGDAWTDWSRVTGEEVTAKPAAVVRSPNDVDLFYRGLDNRLYMKLMRGGMWQSPRLLGGTLTSGPTAVIDKTGGYHVFVRGYDNGVWELTSNDGGGSWSAWVARGQKLTSELSAGSMTGNRVDLFARGSNDQLMQLVVIGKDAWWYDLGGSLTSGPAVASRDEGLLDVYARFSDNAMWHKAWDGFRWTAWDNRGGVLTSDPAATVGRDEAVDVYVRGYDNGLWMKPT